MLDDIRHSHPTAYAQGFTLNAETVNGLDSTIEGPNNATMLAFQFKKAYQRVNTTFWFHFNNNRRCDQHSLVHAAQMMSGSPSVFYALPAFENIPHLARHSPRFLNNTFFINPIDIDPINDGQIHQIELDTRHLTYVVHSEKVLAKGTV